jgi:hypothetical protein
MYPGYGYRGNPMAGVNPMTGANPMAASNPMARPNQMGGQNPNQGPPGMGYPHNMPMRYPGPYGPGPAAPQASPYPTPYGQQPQYGMGSVPGAYGHPQAAPGYSMPTPYKGAVPMNQPDARVATDNQPVKTSSGGGMPQTAPTINYPTVEKIQFHIPANLKEKYSNLYSIIATVDALMTEEIEGNVSQEDIDSLMPNYKNMYEMIKKGLRIDDDQVKAFCDSVNLTAGYAFHAFERINKPVEEHEEKRALSAGELMQLGTRFTTLSDYCSFGAIKTSEINALYKDIIATIGKTDFFKENDEGASLSRQGKELLNSQPQDQPLDEDVRRDFMYKISTLHGLFMGSL